MNHTINKMKKVHISFGDNKYNKSLALLKETTTQIGKVDEFIQYKKSWLQTTDFWKKNGFILQQPRGAGYWIWKPYLILETFKSLEDGDVVLYSDAGLKVIGNLNPLFKIAQEGPNGGKILFKLPPVDVPHHQAKTWTKRDAFILMNCDSKEYWEAPMGNGAVSLWKKSSENIEFLKEWQRYLRDPRIVTDDPNMCGNPNFLEFKDHRHDQSVLTLLSKKYNFELFRDPTQYGNDFIEEYPNSPYEQLFYHHRNFTH